MRQPLRRSRGLPVFVLALTGWLPCSGAAVGSVARPWAPAAGPVLVGDGDLAWSEVTRGGAVNVLQSARGRIAVAKTFSPSDNAVAAAGLPPFRSLLDLFMAGDGQRLAVEASTRQSGPVAGSDRGWAGHDGQPLAPISPECPGPGVLDRSIDVSGSRAVAVGPTCDQRAVFDLDTDAVVSTLPSDANTLRISGRYVAYLRGSRQSNGLATDAVEVRDADTGALVFTVADPGGAPSQLSVQADGKVLYTYTPRSARDQQAVGWASPEEPFTHLLVEGGRNLRGVIAGDQVVLASRPLRTSYVDSALDLYNLDGTHRRLAAGIVSRGLSETFDFDGQHVAWISRSCHGVRIRSAPLAQVTGGRVDHCRLDPPSQLREAGRAVRGRVSCRGFARACVVVDAWLETKAGTVVARQADEPVTGAGSFYLKCTRDGERFVRQGKPLRLSVVLADDAVTARERRLLRSGRRTAFVRVNVD